MAEGWHLHSCPLVRRAGSEARLATLRRTASSALGFAGTGGPGDQESGHEWRIDSAWRRPAAERGDRLIDSIDVADGCEPESRRSSKNSSSSGHLGFSELSCAAGADLLPAGRSRCRRPHSASRTRLEGTDQGIDRTPSFSTLRKVSSRYPSRCTVQFDVDSRPCATQQSKPEPDGSQFEKTPELPPILKGLCIEELDRPRQCL